MRLSFVRERRSPMIAFVSLLYLRGQAANTHIPTHRRAADAPHTGNSLHPRRGRLAKQLDQRPERSTARGEARQSAEQEKRHKICSSLPGGPANWANWPGFGVRVASFGRQMVRTRRRRDSTHTYAPYATATVAPTGPLPLLPVSPSSIFFFLNPVPS